MCKSLGRKNHLLFCTLGASFASAWSGRWVAHWPDRCVHPAPLLPGHVTDLPHPVLSFLPCTTGLPTTPRTGEDVARSEPSYAADGNVRGCRHFAERGGGFSKSKAQTGRPTQPSHCQASSREKQKHASPRALHTSVHSGIIIMPKMQKPNC